MMPATMRAYRSRPSPSRLRSGWPGLRQPSGSRMVIPFHVAATVSWREVDSPTGRASRRGSSEPGPLDVSIPGPRRRRGTFTFAAAVAGKLVVSAACPLREYARDSAPVALQPRNGHHPALEFPGLSHLAHGEPPEHVPGDRAELPRIAG